MVTNDCKLETDLPFAPFGTAIYDMSWDQTLTHLNRLPCITCLLWDAEEFSFDSRCLVLWVPFSEDVFGPEKNAALSLGVGSDDDHPCPVIVRACWSRTTSPLAEGVFLFSSSSFTAVRRCRPGVRCCSGRCGYDRGMGRKAPRAIDLWVIWCSPGSRVRDAWLVQLYIIQLSEVNLELCC